jgi:acyl CoA:acetate/3-ketoacid CoA transferase beta subunit
MNKPGKDIEKRERIVNRIARELRDGFYVNLGIGMPTLVANHVPPGLKSCFNPKTACWASVLIRSRARRTPT